MVPRQGRCTDLDAIFQSVITEISTPFPGRDRHMCCEHVGTNSHALGSVKSQWSDIGSFKAVGPDHLFLCVIECVGIIGHIHTENVC